MFKASSFGAMKKSMIGGIFLFTVSCMVSACSMIQSVRKAIPEHWSRRWTVCFILAAKWMSNYIFLRAIRQQCSAAGEPYGQG